MKGRRARTAQQTLKPLAVVRIDAHAGIRRETPAVIPYGHRLGIIALELDGDPDVIEAAVGWLREQGVTVEPIEKNVIE